MFQTQRLAGERARRSAVRGDRFCARRSRWPSTGRPTARRPLIETLNEIGGKHGIGRVDLVENRLVGMKSHGVYETPGGTILYAAHRELESITLDRDTLHYKDMVGAALCRAGLLRPVVHAAARGAGSLLRQDTAERDRHGAAEAVQGQRASRSGARVRTACIAKTSPRSARRMSTIRRTRRASSSCSACRSRCAR